MKWRGEVGKEGKSIKDVTWGMGWGCGLCHHRADPMGLGPSGDPPRKCIEHETEAGAE